MKLTLFLWTQHMMATLKQKKFILNSISVFEFLWFWSRMPPTWIQGRRDKKVWQAPWVYHNLTCRYKPRNHRDQRGCNSQELVLLASMGVDLVLLAWSRDSFCQDHFQPQAKSTSFEQLQLLFGCHIDAAKQQSVLNFKLVVSNQLF